MCLQTRRDGPRHICLQTRRDGIPRLVSTVYPTDWYGNVLPCAPLIPGTWYVVLACFLPSKYVFVYRLFLWPQAGCQGSELLLIMWEHHHNNHHHRQPTPPTSTSSSAPTIIITISTNHHHPDHRDLEVTSTLKKKCQETPLSFTTCLTSSAWQDSQNCR